MSSKVCCLSIVLFKIVCENYNILFTDIYALNVKNLKLGQFYFWFIFSDAMYKNTYT